MNICTYNELLNIEKDYLTSTEVAKDYGLSAQSLNKILCKLGFLRNTYDTACQYEIVNTLYGKYFHFNKSLGEYTESLSWNSRDTLKISKKGRLKIYQLFKNVGILPICELLLNYSFDDNKFSKSEIEGKYSISLRKPFELNINLPKVQTIFISYRHNRNKYLRDDFSINYLPLSNYEYNLIKNQMGVYTYKIEQSNPMFIYLKNFMLNKFYKKIKDDNIEKLLINQNKKLVKQFLNCSK